MNLSESTSPPQRPAGLNDDAGRALGSGVRIGPYEIQAVIAESASAIVYLASDRALETQVAIKEYLPRIARRDAAGRVVPAAEHAEAFRRGLRSFNAAARTLAHIDHPASARALLLWQANATSYLAMPYYPGTRLLELRRGMRTAPDEASLRALLDGLLGALDAYHRRDSIHGGVSPSKILLLPDDSPLLLGAGTAARFPGEAAWPAPGTAAEFVPPEQATPSPHAPLGPWTDLYALAGVLRFCISGVAPGSPGRALHEAFADAPSNRRGSVPQPSYGAALLETLEAALSPDWRARPQSAEQFREWLGRAPGEPTPRPVAVPSPQAGAPLATSPALESGHRQPPLFAANAPTPAFEASAPTPAFDHRPPSFDDNARTPAAFDARRPPAFDPNRPPAPFKAGTRADPSWAADAPAQAEAKPEPGFDPAAVDAATSGDSTADEPHDFAWNAAANGSARRRREALLGSVLLIALALGGVLFATSAWKSLLPATIDMGGAPPAAIHPGAAGAEAEADVPPAADPSTPADPSHAGAAGGKTGAMPALPADMARPDAPATAAPHPGSSAGVTAPTGATGAISDAMNVGGDRSATGSAGSRTATGVAGNSSSGSTGSTGGTVGAAGPHSATGAPGSSSAVATAGSRGGTGAMVAKPAATDAGAMAAASPSAAPVVGAMAARSPREACGDRSQFALYRCMQAQCATSLWHGHAQCQRLRESDRVE